MSERSLFEKFMNLFSKTTNGSSLSASRAIHLQNTYIKRDCSVTSPLLPPYIEIAKQLYSSEPKIFNAALYYLQKIARNEPAQSAQISDILTARSKDRKISADKRQQILNALQTIKDNSSDL